MEDVRIADNQLMALAETELSVFSFILDTGDRADYGMAYYAMSGTPAVSLEARITSFSGATCAPSNAPERVEQAYAPTPLFAP